MPCTSDAVPVTEPPLVVIWLTCDPWCAVALPPLVVTLDTFAPFSMMSLGSTLGSTVHDVVCGSPVNPSPAVTTAELYATKQPMSAAPSVLAPEMQLSAFSQAASAAVSLPLSPC